jgi:hypothetical protein
MFHTNKLKTNNNTNKCKLILTNNIYITIIVPALLYGRETWSLTLREEHRLRVFENGVLRKIPGSMRSK